VPNLPHTVRAATADDSGAVHDLARVMAVTFDVDQRAFHRAFAELVTDEGAHLLVADVDDRVAGYLLGFTHPSFFANGPVAWVEEVAVAADLRRHAVGKGLVAEFERRARDDGCQLVALATTRAQRFYRALGYDEHAAYFRKIL
jgi:GNAT superfamily N-acetyltransferase